MQFWERCWRNLLLKNMCVLKKIIIIKSCSKINRNILTIEQKVKELSRKSRTTGSIEFLFVAIVSDGIE
jgi:hypothetical protein